MKLASFVLAPLWLGAFTVANATADEPPAAEPTAARSPAAEASGTSDAFCLGGLCLDGYLQADAVMFDQASQAEIAPSGAPLNEARFLVRRAFLRAAYARGPVGAVFQLDADTVNGPQVRVVNAEVFLAWRGAGGEPPLALAALGLMKIPFGREVLEGDQDRLFLERSNAARALFPGVWDAGARVEGAWGPLRWVLAAMNGEPIGEKSFAGLDPNPAKDLLGRLGFVHRGERVAVAAGVSALGGTGLHPGTPATKDTLVWRDTNEDGIVQITELQVIPGSAATPSSDFSRFALGADLLVSLRLDRTGTTMLAAEVTWAQNLDRGLQPADPIAAGRDLRELGAYVQVVQDVTRWGQLGLRYDWYQPDRDANQRLGAAVVPENDRFATLAAVAAFLPAPTLRLVLEYDHNWNALGLDASGQPTTLGSDVLTLRGQVLF